MYAGAGDERASNHIPFPDFTDFRLADYPFKVRLPPLFSRGCVLNCTFCTNKWNHLNQRTRRGENDGKNGIKRDT